MRPAVSMKRPISAVVFLLAAALLGGCVLETPKQIFSARDIVKVNAEKAAKLGFTPNRGNKTYMYAPNDADSDEIHCSKVGFVPLDDQEQLYIATNFSKDCTDEEPGRTFYMLVDFENVVLKAFSTDGANRDAVVDLADQAGLRVLYDKANYRYVAVDPVSKSDMKGFFLALAKTELLEELGDK